MPEQAALTDSKELAGESYPTEVHLMVDRLEEIRDTLTMMVRMDVADYTPVHEATQELVESVNCEHCEDYLRGILAGIAFMQGMETAAPTENDPWDRKSERLEVIEKDINDWIEEVGKPFIEDMEGDN
jgi:hypothetical protein